MAITQKLNFTRPQLRMFAQVFKAARAAKELTQLQVARAAFEYEVSHCKVSRIERTAMPKVDAYCINQMAKVLDVDRNVIRAIDPHFDDRLRVIEAASRRGFWTHAAAVR